MMMKTRSTKELLQIVLNEGNKTFLKGTTEFESDIYEDGFIGLCGFIRYLKYSLIINNDEYQILLEFIVDHKPKKPCEFYAFCWNPTEWKPRKKWLTTHINKLKNENKIN